MAKSVSLYSQPEVLRTVAVIQLSNNPHTSDCENPSLNLVQLVYQRLQGLANRTVASSIIHLFFPKVEMAVRLDGNR